MSFDMIKGQDFVVSYLKRVWGENKVPHAFLFAGQRGVGKKTAARFLAMLKFCTEPDMDNAEPCGECRNCKAVGSSERSHPDMCMLLDDPSSKVIKIGQKKPPDDPDRLNYPKTIGELRYAIQKKSSLGRGRFVLIEKSEKMNRESGNSLLKSIEEPPEKTQFVLTTENLKANLPTIISRCHVLRFPDLTEDVIADILTGAQGIDRDTAERIAHVSHGSLTRANEISTNNILSIREWICSMLMDLHNQDPFELAEEMRRRAPGMVYGFDREGNPNKPDKKGGTSDPVRRGLEEIFSMMLEFMFDRSLGVLLPGREKPLSPYFDTEKGYWAHCDESVVFDLQQDIIKAQKYVQRTGSNVEMITDNLLREIYNKTKGAVQI